MRLRRRRRLGFALILALGVTLATTVGPMAEPALVELAIRDGHVPEDRRVVRARQGDEVTISFTTDRALILHLQGYDLEVKLVPEKRVAMRFTVRATGRFPIEIHGAPDSGDAQGAGRTIAYLEVHPR